MKKTVWIMVIALALALAFTACGGDDGGDPGGTPVTFDTSTPPSANGSATATTTEITFTLSEAIAGLTADDITLSGVAGVTKGTLSGAGPTYTLGISGFTAGGELTVTITKTGYTISGSQTVTIFYYSGPHVHQFVTGQYLCTECNNPGALGDTGPGGGKIFYVSTAGFTMTDDGSTAYYLEAAPANMATTLAWASTAYYITDITGTADGIGTGRKNTAVILATDANAPAAKACNDYNVGGKNDWFLPSRDELNQLNVNRNHVGNMEASNYWSSSQYDDNDVDAAWTHDFNNGNQYAFGKNSNSVLVRAVRAF